MTALLVFAPVGAFGAAILYANRRLRLRAQRQRLERILETAASSRYP